MALKFRVKLPRSRYRMGYTHGELAKFMKPSELEKFNDWIGGQTVAVGSTGQALFYQHDVGRFLEMVRHGGPDYFD